MCSFFAYKIYKSVDFINFVIINIIIFNIKFSKVFNLILIFHYLYIADIYEKYVHRIFENTATNIVICSYIFKYSMYIFFSFECKYLFIMTTLVEKTQ